MSKVTLKNVYKIYPGERGKDVTAVENFSLEIFDREFVVFVGSVRLRKIDNACE